LNMLVNRKLLFRTLLTRPPEESQVRRRAWFGWANLSVRATQKQPHRQRSGLLPSPGKAKKRNHQSHRISWTHSANGSVRRRVLAKQLFKLSRSEIWKA